MKFLIVLSFFTAAFSLSVAKQPFIDSIKNDLEPRPDEGSYTEKAKAELDPPVKESYIEKVKAEEPDLQMNESNTRRDFTQKVKNTLPPLEDDDSAIQAVLENRSELKMKRPGEIRNSFSIALAAYIDNTISGGAIEAQPFVEVYDGWNPDLQLTYEYKLFNIEGLGSFGAFGNVGISYFRGKGTFEKDLTNVATGDSFGSSSNTQVQFYVMPITLGAKLQVNLLKYVRPFAKLGPMIIPYLESVEGVRTYRGFSNSIYFSGGASILLDWFSRDATWDSYDNYGFKHIYFTVEYLKMFPLRGDVSFSTSGIFGGVTFDF